MFYSYLQLCTRALELDRWRVSYGYSRRLAAQPGQERIRLKDSIYSKGKWQYQKVDFAVFKDWSSSMMTYLEELRQGTWG